MDIFLKENDLDQSISMMEKNVLSAVMNSHKDAEDVFLLLSPIDFDIPENRILFNTVLKLKSDGKNVDYLSLINFIKNNDKYSFNNFEEYIIDVYSMFNYENNIKGYIELIKINSISKQLNSFGRKLQDLKLDVMNYGDVLWELEKEFLDIVNSKKHREIESISKIIVDYQEKLDLLKKHKTELTGCPSGYSSLDRITNGFQPGDLIILAARPGIGKTAISLNFLLNAAKELYEINRLKDKNEKEEVVMMFSMEMGNEQICERLVSIDSTVDITITKRGQWDSLQWNSVCNSIAKLSILPIYIDDSSNLTISDLQSKVKQISSNKKIRLIVVDYLQLLKAPSGGIGQNRQQEVANISRTLKSIARQYEVPIIAIAQLSRKIEERRGEAKRPILSDLRESGSIEQDADLVTFLNYKDTDSYENSQNGDSIMVEYIIAKHRNGSTGIVDLFFEKTIGKYIELK